jgi:hypothetical protein
MRRPVNKTRTPHIPLRATESSDRSPIDIQNVSLSALAAAEAAGEHAGSSLQVPEERMNFYVTVPVGQAMAEEYVRAAPVTQGTV